MVNNKIDSKRRIISIVIYIFFLLQNRSDNKVYSRN